MVNVQLPEVTNRYFVFIPGGGVIYRPMRQLEILAGVHRGFVPNSPTQGGSVPPELSVNYEAGFRFNSRRVSIEAIGFFSDFSNLIGTCSFSTGCAADRVGLEFSGGSVHSYGAEVEASVEIPVVGTVIVPMRVAYTLQQSIFQDSFVSSNPQWGIVEPGYHMPYIPEHQVYASIGLRGENWGVEGYGHYTSKMRDIASIADDLGAPTEATRVFHGAAHYRVEGWGQLYTSVENIVNEPYIVSRRPMGARPGVPRRIVLGYKNEF
jgi:Fe(3+) dicitrate transport protein